MCVIRPVGQRPTGDITLTSEIPDGLSEQEKALLARVNRPMPLRAQRELAVCIGMDQFELVLDGFRAVLSTATASAADMSPYASPAALQAGWKESWLNCRPPSRRLTSRHRL